MKNIINEKPSKYLVGRLKASEEFVDVEDIIGKRVLDIGCGYGWFEMSAISKNVDEIVACEPTEDDLTTIRKNIVDSHVDIKVASAIDLPFTDHSFDTVVVWEVIEHIPHGTEAKMFEEIARVLKIGGKLYLSTPYANLFSKFFDPAWWLVNHRHYSAKSLDIYAHNSGFEVSKVKIAGRWWLILDILNMYFSKWILRRRKLFRNFFDKKVEDEYSIENGFVNIFVSFIKVSDVKN